MACITEVINNPVRSPTSSLKWNQTDTLANGRNELPSEFTGYMLLLASLKTELD